MNHIIICVPLLISGPGQTTSKFQEELSSLIAEQIEHHFASVPLRISSQSESSLKPVSNSSKLDCLAPRELEVLMCIAGGDSYKVVAKKLGISPNTVAGYKKEIYRKLDVNTVAQATRVALMSHNN